MPTALTPPTRLPLQAFTTEDENIANNEGPFIPSAFFTYTTPEAQGLVARLCPNDNATFSPRMVIFNEDRAFYSLLP